VQGPKIYGIDLDGVCFDFLNGFRVHLNTTLGCDLKEEDILSYYWYEDSKEVSKEDFFREFHNYGREGGYRSLAVLAGSLEALRQISARGHIIHYVTNRPKYSRGDTSAALEQHKFPQRENLHFANGNKSPIIRELAIDTFIDDSPHTLAEIVVGTRADVYCRSYKYNEHLDDTFMNRVASLQEMVEIELGTEV
jgi:5'(3')-deoxyribonucleotidase